MKLDLGCGTNARKGFEGVDISPNCGAKHVHNLALAPWPFADNSVDEVFSSHFFEHLTGEQRIVFMHELYRVMKLGARATIITPYWTWHGAVQDPTHQWPPICEQTYQYFSKSGREALALYHYPITCDFEVKLGLLLAPEWADRPEQERAFAARHYLNVVHEIHAMLTKL